MNALDALPDIAGHVSEELIREDDHEWMLRTRFGGRVAATRIARITLPAEADGMLRASVLAGAPLDESLPWELRRILEGHRVRSSLPLEWPLPTVLASGLAANGHPYVTRAWIDGVSMARAWPSCTTEVRDDALEQLLWLIERLHDRGVVFQDLKPDNVVLDGSARVWLVDLESLRSSAGPIPCTHYTPKYAAPEQLVGRSSAPSSDLFAFGRLLTELAGGEPRWAGLAAACLALDPRLRPTAAEAIRWLHGETPKSSAEATIRVPEPVPDAPVTSPNVPRDRTAEAPLDPVVVAVAPKGRIRRTLGALAGATTLAAAVGIGLILGAQPPARPPESTLVADIRDGLRDHKVLAEKNNDGELARLLVLARQASILEPSPDALGEVALATVWSQRWHWRGAGWDPAAFAIADTASRSALVAGETPEAVLARGLAAAAGCRHAPSTETRREAWCAEALTRLDRAAEIGETWLAVEARWGAVMVLNTETRRALDRGDAAAAEARAAVALRQCELAGPLLPAAPVNGVELVEDCLWAAGAARDQSAWHGWTGWWIRHQSGALGPGATAFLLRSAAPECARIQVNDQGIPLALDDGGWASWCAAMTARTLRCVDPRGRKPGWCPR